MIGEQWLVIGQFYFAKFPHDKLINYTLEIR